MAYVGNTPELTAQRIVTEFTATAGQTTFSPSSGYTVGYVDVYLNGVKLVLGDDYVASNGATVVLTPSANLGDVVETVAYRPRGLTDVYDRAEADAKFLEAADGLSIFTTTNLTEGTNLYYTDTRARSAVSVTDSGGDGSLSYNNTSGVITYTGPSATEVRAHFSAGTGITINSGQITNSAPNVTTDISVTQNSSDVLIASSDGTDGTINAATTSLAGVMSSADKTKLDGIASGATANTGTVTSVSGTGTVAGLTLSGTVTSSGNLTLGGTLSTSISTINDSTTVGQNLVKLTNPSAITFLRLNADNTVSSLSAADFRTAIDVPSTSHTHSYLPLSGGTLTSNLIVQGTVTHNGLTPTSGTAIDQIYTHTENIQVTTSWIDTAINASDLATGTYLVQLLVDNYDVAGDQYTEYYSGIMSWFATNTNSESTDEIVLHRAGHAPNTGIIYLRVTRTLSANADDLKLQISSNINTNAPDQYTFKFRRMI